MNIPFLNDPHSDVKERVLEELRQQDPQSPEFATALDHLERLNKLKHNAKRWFTSDAMLAAITPVVCTIILVGAEQRVAITSKATSFLKMPKTPN